MHSKLDLIIKKIYKRFIKNIVLNKRHNRNKNFFKTILDNNMHLSYSFFYKI